MSRCIAIETVHAELLETCLEAAGCTEDEVGNALWITEQCQTGSTSGDESDADREGELRRRSLRARNRNNIDARADTTTTSTDDSSATSTSTTSSSTSTALPPNSAADFNLGLSSAIVGGTLGVAATAAFLAVFVLAWRDGASKRRAKRAAAQKEALLANMS